MRYTGDLAREAAARSAQEKFPERVRLIGYWWVSNPNSGLTFPNLARTLLPDREWKLTSKILTIKTLTVIDDLDRILNGYWDQIKVTGVVDTAAGSPIPFFIERQKAERLRMLIDRESVDIINL